jgi:hypothetical protein
LAPIGTEKLKLRHARAQFQISRDLFSVNVNNMKNHVLPAGRASQ